MPEPHPFGPPNKPVNCDVPSTPVDPKDEDQQDDKTKDEDKKDEEA